jgi:hypothetical protein
MVELLASEAELNFIDDEPPGLFPQNQDSVFGIKRRIFTDQIQEATDQLRTIYAERFVNTSTIYLDEWEKEVGLPVSPTLDINTRRARILGRVHQGPFTRLRRATIVEKYISATFGDVPSFGIDGLVLDANGITLHNESGDVVTLYTITENIPNFSYLVTIDFSVTVDMTGLVRELEYITPAGISFSIVSSFLTKEFGDGQFGDDTFGGI